MNEARPVCVSVEIPDVPVTASAGAELRAATCDGESDWAEHPGPIHTSATRIHDGERIGASLRRPIGCERRQDSMRPVYARTIPSRPLRGATNGPSPVASLARRMLRDGSRPMAENGRSPRTPALVKSLATVGAGFL